jgi:DNA-binding transcriptional MerR regulator
LSRITRRLWIFLKDLAKRDGVRYRLEMLTAKEIANRLAFPAGQPGRERDQGRQAVDVRNIKPGEGGASGYSPAIGQPAKNQAEIDAMWDGIVAKGNALVEAVRPMFERVRHWTREGLLSPAGEKNPGTGRARLYDESAFRKARVLNSLTECGLTVRNLHVISNFLDSKADEWMTKPATGSCDLVYLVIQKFRWIEERDMQIRQLKRGDEPMLGKNVEYAIVVDLAE